MLCEPKAGKLYVFEGASSSVEVIDPATLKVVAMIPASGSPEFAAADVRGHVYFNVEDRGEIDVIDTATQRIGSVWPLKGCENPTGLALDAAHGRLFSSCQNGVLAVTDTADGRQVADVPIGAHPDAVVFDAATQTVLTSCGDGTLNVASERTPDRYAVRENLRTARGARTFALDSVDRRLCLPTVKDGRFVVVVAAPQR
ncbi:MAG: hypothetical protein KGN16_12905 [Burkholderiales bacterium]|nr:hypothetical protein [Burkholderiales bacterium]